jgi:hypothetical protein
VEPAAGRAHPHRRAHLHRRTNARGPPLSRTVVFGISGSGCPARRHQPPRSNRDGGFVVKLTALRCCQLSRGTTLNVS